jgi:anti-anti-sigma factor
MNKLDYRQEKDTLVIVPQGKLDTDTAASLWRQAINKLAKTQPKMLVIDAQALECCDGAGIALLEPWIVIL